MKICGTCLNEKEALEFYASKQSKDGLCWACKSCMKNKANERRLKEGPQKRNEYIRQWRAEAAANKKRLADEEAEHARLYRAEMQQRALNKTNKTNETKITRSTLALSLLPELTRYYLSRPDLVAENGADYAAFCAIEAAYSAADRALAEAGLGLADPYAGVIA